MTSVILHLDMNSYFASVLQQDNVEYRGKVLGVCEHLGGIIISASKEAKQWDIKTGTPVWEAKKIYPKIILTHTTAERFRFYTRRLVKLVSEYTDKVEVYSIDEVFLDITRVCNIQNSKSEIRPVFRSLGKGENPKQISNLKLENLKLNTGHWPLVTNPYQEAVNIALEIKQRMKQAVGDYLTCSIGIAENKVLAKIGSDLKKPDGIVVIMNNELGIRNYELRQKNILFLNKQDLYHQLKLTDVPGIGERQEKNLNALGIKTLLDLKTYPQSHLLARFGRIGGYHLYNLGQLNASWKSLVRQEQDLKSIGHMYTLPKEYRKPEFFEPVLFKLCEMVARRLRRKGLEGNVINAFCYFRDHQSYGKSVKVGDYVSDGREIFRHAMEIFKTLNTSLAPSHSASSGHALAKKKERGSLRHPLFSKEGGGGVREFKMIGITVSHLRSTTGQLSLFGHREENKGLLNALDKINDKYGEFTVARTPILATGKVFRDSVGFGRVKEL